MTLSLAGCPSRGEDSLHAAAAEHEKRLQSQRAASAGPAAGGDDIELSLDVKRLCTRDRLTKRGQEPRSDPEGLKRYFAPGSDARLVTLAVKDGWYFALWDPRTSRYWIAEIEGPDHGVRFFGPFDGDPRANARLNSRTTGRR